MPSPSAVGGYEIFNHLWPASLQMVKRFRLFIDHRLLDPAGLRRVVGLV